VGTIADQPAFNSLAPLLPASFDASGLRIKEAQNLSAHIASLEKAITGRWESLIGKPLTAEPSADDNSPNDAVIEEIESPASAKDSIVTITLRQESVVDDFAKVLRDPSRKADIDSSLVVFRSSKLTGLASHAATYHVGDISLFAVMRLYLTHYFMLLLVVVLSLCFLSARYAYGWMAWHAQERLKLAQPDRDDD